MRARALLAMLVLVAAVQINFPPSPVFALSNPCSYDPNNLISNGMMREGGLSQWGPVADRWNAFVLSGSPLFNWVDNEGIDPEGSQYIEGDAPYDAGIYQTVEHLQPGEYYHFWVGYALAAYDNGNSVNQRYDQIGRMIGIDPNGGTDATSPNVHWGAEYTGGVRALTIPELSATFPAQSDKITVFVRAINHSSQYRNKVWFDAICMEARADLPTATPNATATPTQTAVPPTNTPRPTRVPNLAPVATRVPTDVPTLAPTATVQPSSTPNPTKTPRPTDDPASAVVHRAIPNAGTADTTTSSNFLGMAVLFGSFGIIGFGLVGILGLVGFIVWRMWLHQHHVPAYARPLAPRLPRLDEMDEFNEAIDPRIAPQNQLPDDIF